HEQREYEPPSGFAEPSSAAARPKAPAAPDAPVPGAELVRAVLEGKMSVAELRHRYILHVYALVGSYVEAAKRLQIDWRTVRSAVELEAARGRAAGEAGRPGDMRTSRLTRPTS